MAPQTTNTRGQRLRGHSKPRTQATGRRGSGSGSAIARKHPKHAAPSLGAMAPRSRAGPLQVSEAAADATPCRTGSMQRLSATALSRTEVRGVGPLRAGKAGKRERSRGQVGRQALMELVPGHEAVRKANPLGSAADIRARP